MKTKSIFLLLIFMAIQHISMAQTATILFVNDNGVIPANTDTVRNTLDHSIGQNYDVFDARDSLRSPDFQEMINYELVIWYCSSDGVGNYFWDGNDVDNIALKQYLDQGGKLWVMGTDLLYDRFTAPQIFNTGDFCRDYMGVSQYYAQSYGNDGNTGVELLDAENLLMGTPALHWIFPTAWWVDACVPASNAWGLYRLGPEGYILDPYFAGILLDSTFKTVSFFFDPAIIDTYTNRLNMMNTVLSTVLNITSIKENATSDNSAVYPNPATAKINITFSEEYKFNQYLQITDIYGRLLSCVNKPQSFDNTTSCWIVDIEALKAGTYFCSLINSNTNKVVNFIKADQ